MPFGVKVNRKFNKKEVTKCLYLFFLRKLSDFWKRILWPWLLSQPRSLPVFSCLSIRNIFWFQNSYLSFLRFSCSLRFEKHPILLYSCKSDSAGIQKCPIKCFSSCLHNFYWLNAYCKRYGAFNIFAFRLLCAS